MDFGTLLDLINRTVEFADALGRKFTEGREYRRKRFGSVLGELFYWLGILDTESVQRYHLNINFWTKQEALDWRESYKSRCGAVSVAAAIFASIGLTALQLEHMPDAHWSASALVTVSMVLGVFSVVTATSLQNAVTKLSNHREIRLWLSKGVPTYIDYGSAYEKLPLESSAATVKLSEIPTLLLNLAVVTYLLGFGIYLLYGWLRAVEEPDSNFRNVFVFYVCFIGAIISYLGLLWGKQVLDKDHVNQQFNLKQHFDTGTVATQEQLLDKWTDIVEVLSSSKSEAEKQKARMDLDEVLQILRYGPVDKDVKQQPKNSTSAAATANTVSD